MRDGGRCPLVDPDNRREVDFTRICLDLSALDANLDAILRGDAPGDPDSFSPAKLLVTLQGAAAAARPA